MRCSNRARAGSGPRCGAAAQAAHHSAGDCSDEVEVVRSLAPQDAAAEFGSQLFGGAWAVEPVGESPAVDHVEPAKFGVARHLAQAQDARLEAVFDVDAQQHAVAFRSFATRRQRGRIFTFDICP